MKKNGKKHKFQLFKAKLSSLLSKIRNRLPPNLLEKCIMSLKTVSKKSVIILLTINFILGIVILNYSDAFSYFFPHLICLTLNIVITLLIGHEYANTIGFLDTEILPNKSCKKYIELCGVYKQFRHKTFHGINFVLCIIILTIFFWGIFSQHYIKLDVVGWYAIYMVTITVSISVIGYAQYLWLLWFLYRINYCSLIPYNEIIPAYTPFLVKIGTLTKHAKWCFFIEGFLYVFEYFILIPKGNVTLLEIDVPDKASFLVTWGVIFVVIILAFPVIIFIQESLLSKIVKDLKKQRLEALLYNYDIPDIKKNELSPQIYIRNQMINNLIISPDYPIKIQRLGPSVVAAATCVLHIVNLINQYPELKKFLINRFL